MNKKDLKWTEEDELAVEEYKKKLESGEITTISFDEALRQLKRNKTKHGRSQNE